jgi:hypothetical protein
MKQNSSTKDIFLAGALFLFQAMICVQPADAAKPKAPTLKRVSQSGASVSLLAKVKARDAVATSVLQLERANSANLVFEVVAEYEWPAKKQALVDAVSASGLYLYRARIVSYRGISKYGKIAAALFLLPEVVPPSPSTPAPTPVPSPNPGVVPPEVPLVPGMTMCPTEFAGQLLAAVNEDRVAAGLRSVQRHPALDWAARARAVCVGEKGNASCDLSTRDLAEQAGYEYYTLMTVTSLEWGLTVEHIMQGWNYCPARRPQLYDARAYYLGLSCVKNAEGLYVVIGVFGTLESSPY